MLQLTFNIILDLSGMSKKYFSSSGAFLFVCFLVFWELAAIYAAGADWNPEEIIPFLSLFASLVWRIFFAPVIPLIMQLIYSYMLRRFISVK